MNNRIRNVQNVTYLIAVKNDYRIDAAIKSLENDDEIKEIIIVCDGCREEFVQFIRARCATNEPPITCLVKDKSAGLAAALNLGLDHCDTKFVARLDADDVNLPGRSKLQRLFLEKHPEVTMVGGNCLFNPGGQTSNMPLSMKAISELFFCQTVFIHPAVMFNVQNLKNIRYSEQFSRGAQDLVMWATLLNREHKLANISEPVIIYRLPTHFKWYRLAAAINAYYFCGKLLNRRLEAMYAIAKTLCAEAVRNCRRLINDIQR